MMITKITSAPAKINLRVSRSSLMTNPVNRCFAFAESDWRNSMQNRIKQAKTRIKQNSTKAEDNGRIVERPFADYLQETFSGEIVRKKNRFAENMSPTMKQTINRLI